MTIRFALVGAGRIREAHARAVSARPSAKLLAVSDALPAAGHALAALHGAEKRTQGNIDGADDVDAVLICTPTDTHANLIERFAMAGIFCAKPIDLSPRPSGTGWRAPCTTWAF